MLCFYFGGQMVRRFSMLSTFLWNNSFIKLKITKCFLGKQWSTYICNEMVTEWDVLLFFGSLRLGQCAPVAPPTQLERRGLCRGALVEAEARTLIRQLWLAGLAASPFLRMVIGWKEPGARERQKTSLSGVLKSTWDVAQFIFPGQSFQEVRGTS